MIFNFFLISFIFFNFIVSSDTVSRVKRIVGGIPADVPPADDPVVYTRFSGKAAKVTGVRDFGNYVFRGIKYAHPPTGRDRFLRPRQKFLEGEVNATHFSQPCIQPRPGTNEVIGNEDCLAVNIFTPELPMGLEGLPVVVWIHGGAFRYGSASQYGVRHLVDKRLVVVTIQYRLGSLGFLSTGDTHLPGNVALWDMVLAIQWIRNYIGFFGGNPYRIVVMSHGTGASSALLLTLSKIAKGMVSGIVAMSGTAISNWAIDHIPQKTAADIANENGCPIFSSVTMVKCLQNLPPDSIIRRDSDIEFQRIQSGGFMSGLSGGLGAAPVSEGYSDGRSLPGLVEDKPINYLNRKENPHIPLLTGITRDETKRAVRGHMKKDVQEKINTIPNFLDVLVKQLRGDILINQLTSINNLTDSILPLNFGNYLKQQTVSLHGTLNKVAEVTGDALFNLPALLTVNRWSQNGAPTYLYSFEHLGNRQKGHVFLKGSPIIGNNTVKDDDNNTVAHGDDLPYIFDVNDIEGNSLETSDTISEDDQKVRNVFIQMISDFARYGKIKLHGHDVDHFSTEKNNFIQIKAKPTLSSNFKLCEMALWLNLVDTLKSSTCSFLNAFSATDLLDKVPLTLPSVLPDLIDLYPKSNMVNMNPGGLFNLPEVTTFQNLNGNKKSPSSIFGGFLG